MFQIRFSKWNHVIAKVNSMKKDLEKIKEIAEKHNYKTPPEDLLEIQKNISQLAAVILDYERKRKGKIHNTGPPNTKQ